MMESCVWLECDVSFPFSSSQQVHVITQRTTLWYEASEECMSVAVLPPSPVVSGQISLEPSSAAKHAQTAMCSHSPYFATPGKRGPAGFKLTALHPASERNTSKHWSISHLLYCIPINTIRVSLYKGVPSRKDRKHVV